MVGRGLSEYQMLIQNIHGSAKLALNRSFLIRASRKSHGIVLKLADFEVFTSRFFLRCKQILLIALLINDSQVAKF